MHAKKFALNNVLCLASIEIAYNFIVQAILYRVLPTVASLVLTTLTGTLCLKPVISYNVIKLII